MHINPLEVQDQVVHHAANAAAVVIPVGAAVLKAPAILVYAPAILGILWYIVLFSEKITSWVNWFKHRKDKK